MPGLAAGSRAQFAATSGSTLFSSRPLRRQRRCRGICPPSRAIDDDDAPSATTSASSSSTSTFASPTWRTCRHCKRRFDPSAPDAPTACRRHRALFTGGEVSKAIGFCREGQGRENWLDEVVGKSGLLRFWDCCGAEREDAPGCFVGPHEGF